MMGYIYYMFYIYIYIYILYDIYIYISHHMFVHLPRQVKKKQEDVSRETPRVMTDTTLI